MKARVIAKVVITELCTDKHNRRQSEALRARRDRLAETTSASSFIYRKIRKRPLRSIFLIHAVYTG